PPPAMRIAAGSLRASRNQSCSSFWTSGSISATSMGLNEAKYVIQDALLCWRVLRPGGFLLVDDLGFHFPNNPEQDTAKAIDAFLAWFADELSVIERGRQLLVFKTPAG